VLALRRHYLPHEDDDIDSLARALWLDKQSSERLAHAVAVGIVKALNG
jgi:Zn-dependent peptidase ImmA (M78 family)